MFMAMFNDKNIHIDYRYYMVLPIKNGGFTIFIVATSCHFRSGVGRGEECRGCASGSSLSPPEPSGNDGWWLLVKKKTKQIAI